MLTYKLGDCLSMVQNGAVIKQYPNAGGIPITRIETLSNDRFNRNRLGYADITDANEYSSYILDDKDILMSHINSRTFLGRAVIYRKQGNERIIHGMNLLRIKTKEFVLLPEYAIYYFKTEQFKKAIDGIRKDAINQSSFSTSDLKNIEITIPTVEEQSSIVKILVLLDERIQLYEQSNATLEATIRQLFDYWFVQFDQPDENGVPYKSSGGRMVWDEKIKRNIPESWSVGKLADYIDQQVSGDWGEDSSGEGLMAVSCIRGADLKTMENLPVRYIPNSHLDRLLNDGDIVVEMSGGSPTQSTGRAALVTSNTISDNDGLLICSNFCRGLRIKEPFRYYFFYLWQMLYDNGNMFNFEGKTSGLRNLQLDSLCSVFWYFPNESSICLQNFNRFVKSYLQERDNNRRTIGILKEQRDRLLPLIMNGQVCV